MVFCRSFDRCFRHVYRLPFLVGVTDAVRQTQTKIKTACDVSYWCHPRASTRSIMCVRTHFYPKIKGSKTRNDSKRIASNENQQRIIEWTTKKNKKMTKQTNDTRTIVTLCPIDDANVETFASDTNLHFCCSSNSQRASDEQKKIANINWMHRCRLCKQRPLQMKRRTESSGCSGKEINTRAQSGTNAHPTSNQFKTFESLLRLTLVAV